MKNPIDNIVWISADLLVANSWNPNFVYQAEMKLLETSLVSTGWLQPVLVNRIVIDETPRYEIIDGFHRVTLAKASQAVRALSDPEGHVPCAILELSEPERMLLTVRINRAKGTHIAVRMHELVTDVVQNHGYSVKDVCHKIGATKDEVELLLQEGVFSKLKIQEHEYSKAWITT